MILADVIVPTDKFPEPSKELLFTDFILVPETRVFCLVATSLAVANLFVLDAVEGIRAALIPDVIAAHCSAVNELLFKVYSYTHDPELYLNLEYSGFPPEDNTITNA